jgi:phytoene dehydrogenase-like protein
MMRLGYRSGKLGKELTTFLEFMTAPASKILDKWFESDILKATLATDAIIGAKVCLHIFTIGLVLVLLLIEC